MLLYFETWRETYKKKSQECTVIFGDEAAMLYWTWEFDPLKKIY